MLPVAGTLLLRSALITFVMHQERQVDGLREEIEALLAPLSGTPDFYCLVREPLSKLRRGLVAKNTHDRLWPLLPLMVCEAISSHYERSLPAAAAMQLFMAAADVFDDIEDADSPESLPARHGTAVATNVATALLILAEKGLTRLKERGVEDCITVRAMDAINSFYTTACAGQHQDISGGSDASVSEDTYLTVAHLKSATTMECACYLGALLGKGNQEIIDMFTRFGYNLGMASQIANDIDGITQGSDILKRKVTLPVIYALAQADGEAHRQLESAFLKTSECFPDPVQTRDLLFRTGAMHYATIKMEFYKQQALDLLYEAREAGASIESLKLFLE